MIDNFHQHFLRKIKCCSGLCIALLLSASILANPVNPSKDPLQVGLSYSSPPWIDDNSLPPAGMVIELLTTVFHEMGIPVQISVLPPSRLRANLLNQLLQAAIIIDEGSVKVPDILSCTQGLLNIPFGLYIADDGTLPINPASHSREIAWNEMNVGVLRISHLAGTYLNQARSVQSFSKPSMLFHSFKANRINATLSSPYIIKHWESTLDLKLKPILHFNHAKIELCFSLALLSDKAKGLSEQFEKTFFDILDSEDMFYSHDTLTIFQLLDARKPPITVFDSK